MDLHLMENLLTIEEEKSITKAAEKLFVTQSALNQQLTKLESELGTPIFVRNRSDWQPTEAGAVYLAAAKKMLQIKKDTYSRIRDLVNLQKRQVRVGLIPERGVDMFTAVYPGFHQSYPQVLLEPVETNVRKMQSQITDGQIDLGLMTLDEPQKDDNVYLHMAYEEIVLAVPASHPLAHLGGKTIQGAPSMDLSLFSEAPFVLIFHISTMYDLVSDLFREAGFEPQVLFSTSSNLSKYRMVSAGVGCALLPAVFAVPDDRVVFFRLPKRPRWEITMCYRRGAYLSEAEKCFLSLCKKYWDRKILSC
jgi:DNA-binding transcriptional LysR family regulator